MFIKDMTKLGDRDQNQVVSPEQQRNDWGAELVIQKSKKNSPDARNPTKQENHRRNAGEHDRRTEAKAAKHARRSDKGQREHEEAADDWTQRGGADPKTHIKVITERTLKSKQDTLSLILDFLKLLQYFFNVAESTAYRTSIHVVCTAYISPQHWI